jgi:D-alanine-D-alanine ligase
MSGLSVAVIAGGPSTEAAVSRTSAAAVAQALGTAGHRAEVLELDRELLGRLARGGHDVIFPVTHGPLGEDGCLQGLLEVWDAPYVGSGVLASALAASKPHAKEFFRKAGLPLADEYLVSRAEPLRERAKEVRATLGAAVVVKPASGGSAIATSRVKADEPDDALVSALEQALAVDAHALIERFVRGDEVTCGVLERDGNPIALPPTQVLSKAADWYDFESRYAAGGSEHRCPAPFPEPVIARIRDVALRAFLALGCRDLARADFVVSADDGPSGVTLLEVNTLPGMTATSLFPEAAGVAGIPFPALCDLLVKNALARPRRERPAEIPMP